ncbi:hypothetical protein RclHR1_13510003 [Rhizophagus clarus]|uniref:Uncharacterized protein n=1 Tax=Rhizophagus clarus TaxID=94130 RepID=A0A2Z6QA61_9GLOM|nr:hypothetical protein RclHR1_13510003 [Rhizophagus clarus]
MDKDETFLIGNNKTTNQSLANDYCGNFKHMIRTNNTNAVLVLPDETLFDVKLLFNIYSNESRLREVFYISLYDQTLAPSKEDLKFSDNFDDKFVNSLYSLNNYTLIKYHNLYFKVSRRTRRAIIPSIFNYLGLPPQLKDEHYLTSILQTEYAPTIESDLYGNFGVTYQNYLTVIEEEFRVKTILNLLGLLGGAISLMLTVHALLFGSAPVSPWGIIYLLPFINKSTCNKLRDEFNENALPEILSEKSQEQIVEMRKMINHLNRMDIYLKNCIDIETLKKLEDNN